MTRHFAHLEIRRRILLILLIVLSSTACESEQWNSFDSQDGFTVALPQQPEVNRTQDATVYVARSALDLENNIPAVTFIVVATPKLEPKAIDTAVIKFQRMVLEESATAKVIKEEHSSSSSCRTTRLELRDAEQFTLAEIRACGERVFSLVALGTERALQIKAGQFFGSFRPR